MFFAIGSIVLISSCTNSTAVLEESCLQCHSTDVQDAIGLQFFASAHRAGAIAVDYAGGRGSCAPCHSHEQFISWTETGESGNISAPSAWQCKTCHNTHQTFTDEDEAFRVTGATQMIFDTTVVFDNGNSNLCAICHQSRRAEPNIDKPGATYNITSTHYGPHHGAQANVVMGAGFAEIAGSTAYPTTDHAHWAVGCTGCHMDANAEAGEGGHTFNPSLAKCNECHASESFDYGGFQTEVEEMLAELRDLLVDHHVLHPDTTVTPTEYHPVTGDYDMKLVQGFFNWVGLEEDRSLGAHHPKYVEALLKNSIEAVEGL
ncbi:hypothetical protein ACFLT1_01850 [Bacteroidota bacterium]